MFSHPLRRPGAAPLTAVLAVVAGLVVGTAVIVTLLVSGDDTDDRSGPPPPQDTPSATPTTPSSTPLADLDTSTLTVQRAGFCDLVADESIERALGGPPADVSTYGNGERVALTPDVTDIAHEYGCAWSRGRATLRAWVFAPPVTADGAGRLVRAARGGDGCDVRRGAPAYGEPSIARTCPAGRGGRDVEVSYRGLFGDAWLSCSLTARGERRAVLAAADPACVAVAQAAAQPPA